MPSFWRHVRLVIEKAEIIMEVLDARMIEETRNAEIEEKIQRAGKKILYVINKCDLVPPQKLDGLKKNLNPSVFISSKEKLGTTILKKKILEMCHGEKVIVGVVGYPNVGKSSLINALSGRGAARTSITSGFTHGLQKIMIGNQIMLLDTPGVFPYTKETEFKYVKTGALSFDRVKEPEVVLEKLIAENKELFLRYYKVTGEDAEEILENIAKKMKNLLKGGGPNLELASRKVLRDWQEGKIR